MIVDVDPPTGIELGLDEMLKEQDTTVTGMFGVLSPNHVTPSWTICHWKLYVPRAVGAMTVKEKVTLLPCRTDWERSTRLRPRYVLSRGFCEPSLNGNDGYDEAGSHLV